MKVELNLNYEGTFQWTEHEGLYFIGYAFDDNDKLYQHAADFTVPAPTLINELQGAFAIIEKTEHEVSVWVDTAASFQLFYKISDNQALIQNSPNRLDEPLSSEAKNDLLKIYCTQNSDTLLKDWKNLPAGHKLTINHKEENLMVTRWFSHFVQNKQKANSDTEKKFLNMVSRWARQVKVFANGDPVWVPLSGGYDSRLIISSLVRGNVSNLHVYTYGRQDSLEAANAKRIAETLGLDWHFINYDKNLLDLFFTEKWRIFSARNHHYMSVPQEQEFFALHALRKKNLLTGNFVVIPGYCGGTPAGNYVKENLTNTLRFIKRHYNIKAKGLLQDISSSDAFEQWIITNRMSKFLTGGVRVYEYFGGRWMLPMWHSEFLLLFYGLSFEDRFQKRFYKNVLFKYLFDPLKIGFVKQSWEERNKFAPVKKLAKKIIPSFLLKKYLLSKRSTPESDPCNFMILYQLLYDYMKKQKIELPEYDGNFNHLHAIYLLHTLEEKNRIHS